MIRSIVCFRTTCNAVVSVRAVDAFDHKPEQPYTPQSLSPTGPVDHPRRGLKISRCHIDSLR
jgi:hypothetical protein